jgi:two-component system, chemotaxis family, sensor kinase CheA
VEQLQAATTPQQFTVLLETSAGAAEIERAVRSAGDVASVTVERREEAAPAVPAAVSAPAPAAPATAPTPPNRRVAGSPTSSASTNSAARPMHAATPRARHVRIELSRLDSLLNLIGELVIVRGRLQALTRPVPNVALQEAMAAATALITELQSEIMTSRLVPVGQVFDRFPRLVRDVARQLGKDVLFSIEGKEIELDRSVLDEIGEPVVHLLRNAVDHGLEQPDVRQAAGKPRAGRLTLAAQRDRSAVVITVTDDGRGIDRARVLERAIALGWWSPARCASTTMPCCAASRIRVSPRGHRDRGLRARRRDRRGAGAHPRARRHARGADRTRRGHHRDDPAPGDARDRAGACSRAWARSTMRCRSRTCARRWSAGRP